MNKFVEILRVIKYILAIILLVAGIFFAFCGRAKAEEAVSDFSDWFPDSVDTTPIPFPDFDSVPTPEPILTPSPDGSVFFRNAPNDLQNTKIYASSAWAYRQYDSVSDSYLNNTLTYYNINASQLIMTSSGGYTCAVLETNTYWQSTFDYLQHSPVQIGSSLGTGAARRRWNIAQRALQFSVRDVPQDVELSAGNTIHYLFKGSEFSLGYENGQVGTLPDLGIFPDDLTSRIDVFIMAVARYQDGTVEVTYSPNYTWEDFRSGISFHYKIGDGVLSSIDLSLICDASRAWSFVRDAQIAALPEGDLYEPEYVTIYLSDVGSRVLFARSVVVDEQGQNYNFFQRLFMPDQNTLQGIFSTYLQNYGEEGEGTITYFALHLFSDLYSMTDGKVTSWVITLPELSIPIQGTSYTFFNGFSFDWGAFINSPELARVRIWIWTITDILFTLLFVQSLLAVFQRVFGLKLWGGVKGGTTT